jgi:hypothetical protein
MRDGFAGYTESAMSRIMDTTFDLLAQAIVIMATLAFEEENLHTFRHINSQELVWIAQYGCGCGEYGSFQDRILAEIALSECLHTKIPLDDQGTVKAAEDTKDDVEEDFEKMPLTVIADSKHDKLSCSERVHSLEDVSGGEQGQESDKHTDRTAVATRAQK